MQGRNTRKENGMLGYSVRHCLDMHLLDWHFWNCWNNSIYGSLSSDITFTEKPKPKVKKHPTCLATSVVHKDNIVIVQQRVWWGVGVCLHAIGVTTAVISDVDNSTTVHCVLGYFRLATSGLPWLVAWYWGKYIKKQKNTLMVITLIIIS